MEVKGHNGQLELTADSVLIRRKGALSFMTQGLKGEKSIALTSISSIQFKDAGMMTSGYIQFAFIGGHETKGGLFNATSDENTVMFTRKQQSDFVAFRAELEKRRAALASPVPQARSGDLASQLQGLADLRKRGVLSEEEFTAAKARLLG